MRSNRRAEPRRCSGPRRQVVPVRGRRPVGGDNREEYRGARSGPPGPPAHGARAVHGPEGRPASGSGNLLRIGRERPQHDRSRVGLRGQSLHSFRGQGTPGPGLRVCARPGAARPVPRAPPPTGRGVRGRQRSIAAGAFSSVGESARLITVRSLVRIQKGPRPRVTADEPRGSRSAPAVEGM